MGVCGMSLQPIFPSRTIVRIWYALPWPVCWAAQQKQLPWQVRRKGSAGGRFSWKRQYSVNEKASPRAGFLCCKDSLLLGWFGSRGRSSSRGSSRGSSFSSSRSSGSFSSGGRSRSSSGSRGSSGSFGRSRSGFFLLATSGNSESQQSGDQYGFFHFNSLTLRLRGQLVSTQTVYPFESDADSSMRIKIVAEEYCAASILDFH